MLAAANGYDHDSCDTRYAIRARRKRPVVDVGDEDGRKVRCSGEGEGEYEGLSPGGAVRAPADPYANLDGAFGHYVADQPRPQQTDDLLF